MAVRRHVSAPRSPRYLSSALPPEGVAERGDRYVRMRPAQVIQEAGDVVGVACVIAPCQAVGYPPQPRKVIRTTR